MSATAYLDKMSALVPFLISVLLIIPSNSINILPKNQVRPDGTVPMRGTGRSFELSDPLVKQVAEIMASKNFSLLIDFSLDEQTRGTLYSAYGGHSKVLELYAEGLRGELRVHWRRETSLASLHIKHVYDNRFQRILLSLEGWRLRILIDCKEVVAGDYPEIDFSLLSTAQPQIWIGQRNRHQSFFQGSFRRFEIEPTSELWKQHCVPHNIISGSRNQQPTHHIAPVNAPPKVVEATTTVVEELKTKIDTLEGSFNNFLYSVLPWIPKMDVNGSQNGTKYNTADIRKPLPSPPTPKETTDGVCPNCYEYLRYKVNHLEDGLRMWQEKVRTLEKTVHRIVLTQRGCQINSTMIVDDGYAWSPDENCSECVCTLGKIVCKPIGCAPLPSTCAGQRPHVRPGECCPRGCARSCMYLGKKYGHGTVFWPKECVRCECEDGETSCAYRTDQCPSLSCPLEHQYKHENQCCPVCENENFCALHPCHPNATCKNGKTDRECQCKTGFFGDGEKCFDVDECRWDENVAEQLGGCGPGSRCINTPGSFYCECLPGYAKLNERACLDMIIV